MHGHDEVEAVLNALEEDLSVVDIDVELALEGVVDKDAGLDVNGVILAVPVGLEGNWHAVPSLRVAVAESITNGLDDSLDKNVGLLRKV